jgi:hypothetical protein
MSVALLQDNEKHNELEDDRESCLHVLTWTALRFTKHAISNNGTVMKFLRAFDEAYDDGNGVQGGGLKMKSLLSRDISEEVKFKDRPQLDRLVEKLTETFAVRYERPLFSRAQEDR